MLDLTRLTVTYGDLRAVDDVDLAVPDGSVTAVLGPSGCGKSTLLRAVAGLEPVRPGMVAWDGADQAAVPPHRRGFALMFQDGQLFDHLTVERNVGYALRIRKVDRAAARERVAGLLDLVGLAGQGGRLPRQLSGGERQRVALARALAAEPRLLLLDEPLSALDAELRERLAGDLGRILRAAGTTALMVTHDQAEAFAVADRLAVMRAGRLVQAGPTAEVWSAPADAATARFLGYAAVIDGPGAALLGRTAGLADAPAVAVRRAAVRVVGPAPADVADPGTLTGRVASVVPTPDAGHVEVDVEGVGPLPALAPLSRLPRTGERVAIEVDRALLAALVHP